MNLEKALKNCGVSWKDCGYEIVAKCPLQALKQPGVFGGLRWHNGEVRCLECLKTDQVVGNGTLPRDDSEVQQFVCRGCRASFGEYTGTPLEGVQLPLWTWLAIHYYLTRRPQLQPSKDVLARTLGLKLRALRRFDRQQHLAWNPQSRSWRKLKRRISLNEIFKPDLVLDEPPYEDLHYRVRGVMISRGEQDPSRPTLEHLFLRVHQMVPLEAKLNVKRFRESQERRGLQRQEQREVVRSRFLGASDV